MVTIDVHAHLYDERYLGELRALLASPQTNIERASARTLERTLSIPANWRQPRPGCEIAVVRDWDRHGEHLSVEAEAIHQLDALIDLPATVRIDPKPKPGLRQALFA